MSSAQKGQFLGNILKMLQHENHQIRRRNSISESYTPSRNYSYSKDNASGTTNIDHSYYSNQLIAQKESSQESYSENKLSIMNNNRMKTKLREVNKKLQMLKQDSIYQLNNIDYETQKLRDNKVNTYTRLAKEIELMFQDDEELLKQCLQKLKKMIDTQAIASNEIELLCENHSNQIRQDDIDQAIHVVDEFEKQLEQIKQINFTSDNNFRLIHANEYQSAMLLIQDILNLNQSLSPQNEQGMAYVMQMMNEQNKSHVDELKEQVKKLDEKLLVEQRTNQQLQNLLLKQSHNQVDSSEVKRLKLKLDDYQNTLHQLLSENSMYFTFEDDASLKDRIFEKLKEILHQANKRVEQLSTHNNALTQQIEQLKKSKNKDNSNMVAQEYQQLLIHLLSEASGQYSFEGQPKEVLAEKLQEILKDQQTKIQSLQMKVAQLNDELQRNRTGNHRSEALRLASINEEYKRTLDETSELLSDIKAKNQALSFENLELKKRGQELELSQQLITRQENEIQNLNSINNQLSQMLKDAQRQAEKQRELEDINENQNMMFQNEQKIRQNLTSQLAQYKQKIEEMTFDYQQLEERLYQVERENKQINKAVKLPLQPNRKEEKLLQQFEIQSSQIHQLVIEYGANIPVNDDSIQEPIVQLQEILRFLQDQIDELKNKNFSLQNEIIKFQREKENQAKVLKELIENKQDVNRATLQVQQEIEDLRYENIDLKEQLIKLKELEISIGQLKGQLITSKSTIEDQKDQILALKEINSSQLIQINQLSEFQSMMSRERHISQDNMVRQAQEEIDRLTLQINQLTEENIKLKEENKTQNKKLQQITIELKDTHEQYIEIQEKYLLVQSNNQQQRREIEQWRGDLARAEEKQGLSEESLTQEKQRSEQLSKLLQEQTGQIESLRAQINSDLNKITKKDDLIENLKMQVQKLQNDHQQYETKLFLIRQDGDLKLQSKEEEIDQLQEILISRQNLFAEKLEQLHQKNLQQMNELQQQYQRDNEFMNKSHKTELQQLQEQLEQHRAKVLELQNQKLAEPAQNIIQQQTVTQRPPKIAVLQAFQYKSPQNNSTPSQDSQPSGSFYREVSKFQRELDEMSVQSSGQQRTIKPGFLKRRQTQAHNHNHTLDLLPSDVQQFSSASGFLQTFNNSTNSVSNPIQLEALDSREIDIQCDLQNEDIFPPYDHRVCLRCRRNDMVAPNFCKYQVVNSIKDLKDGNNKQKKGYQVSKQHVYGVNVGWRQKEDSQYSSIKQTSYLSNKSEKFEKGVNTILQLVNEPYCNRGQKRASSHEKKQRQQQRNTSVDSVSSNSKINISVNF